jgi:hypothetical protein
MASVTSQPSGWVAAAQTAWRNRTDSATRIASAAKTWASGIQNPAAERSPETSAASTNAHGSTWVVQRNRLQTTRTGRLLPIAGNRFLEKPSQIPRRLSYIRTE